MLFSKLWTMWIGFLIGFVLFLATTLFGWLASPAGSQPRIGAGKSVPQNAKYEYSNKHCAVVVHGDCILWDVVVISKLSIGDAIVPEPTALERKYLADIMDGLSNRSSGYVIQAVAIGWPIRWFRVALEGDYASQSTGSMSSSINHRLLYKITSASAAMFSLGVFVSSVVFLLFARRAVILRRRLSSGMCWKCGYQSIDMVTCPECHSRSDGVVVKNS